MQAAATVSLVQCDAVLGDVARNAEAHLAAIAAAREQGAGLAVFPELSLTGYVLRDLTRDVAMRPGDPGLAPLLEASQELDLVVGFIEEGHEHQFFNAAAYLSGGRVLHTHRKLYPVNYGMFEERRYWAAGDQVAAFDTGFGRAGLLICEDMWHPSTSYLLFADRADLVITPSASPARGIRPEADRDPLLPGSTRAWDALLRHQSTAYNVWSVYVNRCGVEDGISFGGGSCVVDPFGEVVVRLGLAAEQRLVTLDPDVLRRRRADVPILRDERLDVTLGNLERIARDRFVL
jgi:predicted amidohydrolase